MPTGSSQILKKGLPESELKDRLDLNASRQVVMGENRKKLEDEENFSRSLI